MVYDFLEEQIAMSLFLNLDFATTERMPEPEFTRTRSLVCKRAGVSSASPDDVTDRLDEAAQRLREKRPGEKFTLEEVMKEARRG